MSTEMKQMAITLVDEAVDSGSRIVPACELLGLSSRTYRRWRSRQDLIDQRACAAQLRGCPHALTEAEKDALVAVAVNFNKVVRSIMQLSKNAPAVDQFVLTD